MNKSMPALFLLIIPILFSCGNGPSPTSDKNEIFRVGGTVADRAGAGIGGVTVEVTGTNFSLSDTTDSQGSFTFDTVKAGDYKVKACKENCLFKPANMEISVEKTDIDTLKFTSADSYIHGRVIDIVNGYGVEGIEVRIVNLIVDASTKIVSTKTDSNGDFGFFDLERCGYIVRYMKNNLITIHSYTFVWSDFNSGEIIVPDYFSSSENLYITKSEFFTDINILNLEWKPSGSKYISEYQVLFLKNREDYTSSDPEILNGFGGYSVMGDNKDSREINYLHVKKLFDKNVTSGEVFMGIVPVYQMGNTRYYGRCSELIKIRLYW